MATSNLTNYQSTVSPEGSRILMLFNVLSMSQYNGFKLKSNTRGIPIHEEHHQAMSKARSSPDCCRKLNECLQLPRQNHHFSILLG